MFSLSSFHASMTMTMAMADSRALAFSLKLNSATPLFRTNDAGSGAGPKRAPVPVFCEFPLFSLFGADLTRPKKRQRVFLNVFSQFGSSSSRWTNFVRSLQMTFELGKGRLTKIFRA